MTLALELGGIQDPLIHRALEVISLNWPVVDKAHQVGAAGEPAFQNAWVNFDAATSTSRDARFYRDSRRVYLEGLIKSGTVGAFAAFTLPAGYRPLTTAVNFAVNSNGAFGQVGVLLNGDVQMLAGNNTFFSLDGLSFRVA